MVNINDLFDLLRKQIGNLSGSDVMSIAHKLLSVRETLAKQRDMSMASIKDGIDTVYNSIQECKARQFTARQKLREAVDEFNRKSEEVRIESMVSVAAMSTLRTILEDVTVDEFNEDLTILLDYGDSIEQEKDKFMDEDGNSLIQVIADCDAQISSLTWELQQLQLEALSTDRVYSSAMEALDRIKESIEGGYHANA